MTTQTKQYCNWILILIASGLVGFFFQDFLPNAIGNFREVSFAHPQSLVIGKTLGIALGLFFTSLLLYWLTLKFFHGWYQRLHQQYPYYIPWLLWVCITFIGLSHHFGFS
ncbi:MAG: hypothetical protein KIT27_03960 [Legionellales bacterium]|nr:hypothetical protein [Legionellales bacterium]